jgi:hypothetical protein
MFIHALEGPWLSHPFWRTKFLLASESDLHALKSSAVRAVVIDASKGLPGPEGAGPPILCNGVDAEVPQARSGARLPRRRPAKDLRPAALAEEAQRAARIINDARGLAGGLRASKGIIEQQLGLLDPVLEEMQASLTRNSDALVSLVRARRTETEIESKAVALCALMLSLARQLGSDHKFMRDAGSMGFVQPLLEGASSFERAGGATLDLHSDRPALGRHLAGRDRGTAFLKSLTSEQEQLLGAMSDICDIYDSMTAVRDARAIWTPPEAVAQLYRFRDHLDEHVLNAFIRVVGIYPVGSLVRLASGRLAVVVAHNQESLIHPTVLPFYSIRAKECLLSEKLTLPSKGDRIVSREDPERWGFGNLASEWLAVATGGTLPTFTPASRAAA